jgi:hypothetical protein
VVNEVVYVNYIASWTWTSWRMLFSRLWCCVALVTANIVPSSLILCTLMMEAIHSSEMLVLTRATWCHSLGDSILHSHHCENLECYMNFLVNGSLLIIHSCCLRINMLLLRYNLKWCIVWVGTVADLHFQFINVDLSLSLGIHWY